MKKVLKNNYKKIHVDILLLKERINLLVLYEEYERAAVVYKWIIELEEYFLINKEVRKKN